MAVLVALSVVERATPVAAASRPPKFDYQLHTLDNGLSIILNEDLFDTHRPRVTVYDVGSKTSQGGAPGLRTSSST